MLHSYFMLSMKYAATVHTTAVMRLFFNRAFETLINAYVGHNRFFQTSFRFDLETSLRFLVLIKWTVSSRDVYTWINVIFTSWQAWEFNYPELLLEICVLYGDLWRRTANSSSRKTAAAVETSLKI